MRICLISSPAVTELQDPLLDTGEARALISENAPLGVLTLAALLEAQKQPTVVRDLNQTLHSFVQNGGDPGTDDFSDYVADRVAASEADVYGFSTMWSTYPLALRVAKRLKEAQPESRIVFGGPQASLVDVETLEHFPWIDFVIRGEADTLFATFIDAIDCDSNYELIPSLTFRSNGVIHRNAKATPTADLNGLPLPAYHLLEDLCGGHLPLELGRGCPFGCSFCSTNTFFSRRYRLKTAARIIEQMNQLHAIYGVTKFDLIHDMFTADRIAVRDTCRAFIASGMGFEWYCSARTDCVDKVLLDLMYDAGCRGIFFGLETGDSAVQKVIGKNLNMDEAADQVRIAATRGIHTTVSLIMGFPDETHANLAATIKFLMQTLRYDYVDPQVHLLTPLHATPLHDQYRESLRIDSSGDWSHSGWTQSSDDRQLIMAHSDMFTSFHHLPLFHLPIAYIQELRVFLLKGISQFRWLLVALDAATEDLLAVFDQWCEWRSEISPAKPDSMAVDFYSTPEFTPLFLRFIEEVLPAGRSDHGVALMIDYVRALEAANESDFDSLIAVSSALNEGAPLPRRGVELIELGFDLSRTLDDLRQGWHVKQADGIKRRFAIRRAGPRVEVLSLTPFLSDLFSLCDGLSTIEEISRRFPTASALDDIPVPILINAGIQRLCADGLLELQAPPGVH